MTYHEATTFLYDRLPMYQRDGKKAYKKDLSNTLVLLKSLDNPHHQFNSIHIAGTNGKGTCAHGLASILHLSNYKTGLYTSPHLKNFTERIKINGEEVSREFVASFVTNYKKLIEQVQPSFFEITVAMAFYYFAKERVDIAVVETGLGGRLDSTNVLNPDVCLITNISFDHMDILGDTLEKIAEEKAGIIKKHTPVVIGDYQKETFDVFIKKANEKQAPLYFYNNPIEPEKCLKYPYTKRINHQKIRITVKVLLELGWIIPKSAVEKGIDKMELLSGLKGRFQILYKSPLTVADVAHNESGLEVLFKEIDQKRSRNNMLHLIYGTVKDKPLAKIFGLFPQTNTKLYWTQSSLPRSLSVDELAKEGEKYGKMGACLPDVNTALKTVLKTASKTDVILITGSTFMVSELAILN